MRGEGRYQGGAQVMVSLGLCGHGKGALRLARDGGRINADTYLDVLDTTYKVDCDRIFGVDGQYVFMQDGAGPHRANRVTAYLQENFPNVWGTGVWPPSSPGLNVLDYFCWGYLQHRVGLAQPTCRRTLMLAISNAVDAMPLELVRAACAQFTARVNACVAAEGKQFSHMLDRPPRAAGK